MEEDLLVMVNQEVCEKSIPCITIEEYPWAVKTIRDIVSGTENRFKQWSVIKL